MHGAILVNILLSIVVYLRNGKHNGVIYWNLNCCLNSALTGYCKGTVFQNRCPAAITSSVQWLTHTNVGTLADDIDCRYCGWEIWETGHTPEPRWLAESVTVWNGQHPKIENQAPCEWPYEIRMWHVNLQGPSGCEAFGIPVEHPNRQTQLSPTTLLLVSTRTFLLYSDYLYDSYQWHRNEHQNKTGFHGGFSRVFAHIPSAHI